MHMLTRVQRVRQLLDEIRHFHRDYYDGKPDQLDGQLERAVLGLDRGETRPEVQRAQQQQGLDGQQTGDGGGRYQLFHGCEESRGR